MLESQEKLFPKIAQDLSAGNMSDGYLYTLMFSQKVIMTQ